MIAVQNSTFQGHGNLNKSFVRAMYSENSSIIIQNCVFNGNTGITGGALWIRKRSNITIDGGVFSENRVGIDGGAIFAAGQSSVTFKENLHNEQDMSHSVIFANKGVKGLGKVEVHTCDTFTSIAKCQSLVATRMASYIPV